jgi:hypothetical protein
MDELKEERAMPDKKKVKHIKLTSHPGLPGAEVAKPIKWGAKTPPISGLWERFFFRPPETLKKTGPFFLSQLRQLRKPTATKGVF